VNILAIFKSLLNGPGPAAAPAPMPWPTDPDTAARREACQARLADDFRQATAKSAAFEQQYGEFTAFLYRPDFDVFLRRQVLDFWEPEAVDKTFLDKSHWLEKHPANFPGPFYAGESDSCGTGIGTAPANVANDAWYREYIFRQPASYYELQGVLNAAAIEVFESYSANGNEHWTYAACRQWWCNRPQLLHSLGRPNVLAANAGQAQHYAEYLRGPAEMDLRRYCYFLENGVYPPAASTALPAL
jgi:hypothetical protein